MDLKIAYITIFCGDWVRRLLQEHFFLELKIITYENIMKIFIQDQNQKERKKKIE